jgi:voltage-gated potassium channel Kch
MNRKIEWLILFFLGVVAFVLGFIGYNIYFVEQGIHRHFVDLIFHTVKLYGFEVVDEYASPLPISLDIARFLAPGVLIYTALKTLIFLARRELNYLRIKAFKNHIIVSSINNYSRYLINDLLDKREKIILITESEDISKFQDLERKGVAVIQGSLNDVKVLQAASAAKARFIVLLNEDDEHNISTAISAFEYLKNIRNKYETILYAHISDYNKLNELKEINLFDKVVGEQKEKFNYEMRVFSMNERSSRMIFNSHSPDKYKPITSSDDPQPHIAVFGSNEFTQSMIVHFARMSHFVNFKKLKVSLFHQNKKFITKLHQQFPKLAEVVHLNEVECDLDLFDVSDFIKLNDEHKFSSVYLTCRDDQLSLSIFNKLTKINFDEKLDVVVSLIEPDGVLSKWFPDGSIKNIELHKFNVVSETFTIEALLSEKIDQLAKIIHNDYLDGLKKKNAINSDKASHVEWDFLAPEFKEQNRLQADHISVKLRGCDSNLDVNNAELVELLSEVEHNRWCAHMLLNGWKYGEKRDDTNKIHPDLIPFNELSDGVKKYDRDTIYNIPKLIEKYK